MAKHDEVLTIAEASTSSPHGEKPAEAVKDVAVDKKNDSKKEPEAEATLSNYFVRPAI